MVRNSVTYSSFSIKWDKPTHGDPSHYMVYYREISEHETWDVITTIGNACSLEITQLPINTKFVVKVCACTDTEHGPLSAESSPITTRNLAYKIRDASTLRPGSTNSLPIYDVPFHEEYDIRLKIRTVKIGIITMKLCIYVITRFISYQKNKICIDYCRWITWGRPHSEL